MFILHKLSEELGALSVIVMFHDRESSRNMSSSFSPGEQSLLGMMAFLSRVKFTQDEKGIKNARGKALSLLKVTGIRSQAPFLCSMVY